MNIIGLVSAMLGLGFSLYLINQRTQNKKLMCPRKGGCERVVNSVYGKIFGINNDLLGAIFFTSVVVLIPLSIIDIWALFILKSVALISFLYSMYLALLQIFVIRAWCLWCTVLAGLITIILFSVF